jgi:hypothetical protein
MISASRHLKKDSESAFYAGASPSKAPGAEAEAFEDISR